MLAVHGSLRTCRSRLAARPALRRQFLAHQYPRAGQKGGTDNRRRGERGEILQHVMHSTRRLTAAEWPHEAAGRRLRETVRGPARHRERGSARGRERGSAASADCDNSRRSIRVFPSVFGFTRSKSRNSATPPS